MKRIFLFFKTVFVIVAGISVLAIMMAVGAVSAVIPSKKKQ